MHLDFSASHLTPSEVSMRGQHHLDVFPLLATSGSQWFYWAVRVEGLPLGMTGTIDLHWPSVFRAEDLANPTPEDLDRLTKHESFAKVIPDCMVARSDGGPWERIPVELFDENTLRIVLVGTGAPINLATQFPYSTGDLAELLGAVKERCPDALQSIGRSGEGQSIPLLVFAESPDAPIVHIQAGQHLAEFSGPLVMDAMVRRLLRGEGVALLKRFTLHLIPIVDIDGWGHGLFWHRACQEFPTSLRSKNINRDWVDLDYAETSAVRNFAEGQLKSGRSYAALFDLHNGWENRNNTGACYTIFPVEDCPERVRDDQRRVIDHFTDRTDHCPTGSFYWEHDAPGTFSRTASDFARCPRAFTIEFSRFRTWNHLTRSHEPYTWEWHDRFAGQWLEALSALPEPN